MRSVCMIVNYENKLPAAVAAEELPARETTTARSMHVAAAKEEKEEERRKNRRGILKIHQECF